MLFMIIYGIFTIALIAPTVSRPLNEARRLSEMFCSFIVISVEFITVLALFTFVLVFVAGMEVSLFFVLIFLRLLNLSAQRDETEH